MTEIMEYFEIPQSESVYPIPGTRYAIDPVAFFFALICAPLLVALLGFWIVLIPVFAVFIGGLPYLILGTPALMMYLHYRQGSPEGAAGVAALTVIVASIVTLVWMALNGNSGELQGLLVVGGMGVLHAFVWGLAFGSLYNRWRSDASRQPLPPFPHLNPKGVQPC